MNKIINIDTSTLVNYALGIYPDEIASQIKSALEKDEVLRDQYAGIVKLLKENPGEDPEEILERISESMEEKVQALIDSEKKIEAKGKVISMRIFYRIAAIFILTAGIGYTIKYNINHNDPLWMSDYYLSNDIPAERGSGEPDEGWYSDYKSENYNRAINQLLAKDSLSSTETFYLGYCYLKTNPVDPNNAIVQLQKLTDDKYFSDKANYYLGIAYIKLNDKEKALFFLEHSDLPHAETLRLLLK